MLCHKRITENYCNTLLTNYVYKIPIIVCIKFSRVTLCRFLIAIQSFSLRPRRKVRKKRFEVYYGSSRKLVNVSEKKICAPGDEQRVTIYHHE